MVNHMQAERESMKKGALRMKRMGIVTVAILASLAIAVVTLASSEEAASESSVSFVSANQYIGMDVTNMQGEKIGKIRDLMLDRQTGQVGYAILAKGGVLGVKAKEIAVPFNLFRAEENAASLELTVDEGKLAEVPVRTESMTDQEYGQTIHEFYGQAPYWEHSGMEQHQPEMQIHEKAFDEKMEDIQEKAREGVLEYQKKLDY